MATDRFKAYLSYSHKDETWAAWLHRALETYRVPRKLVGTSTSAGVVPARIRPVFRDREDMSSSVDLAETLKKALADSDNLIVICSPDAGASRWVNEEIREFARLGRSSRIFCIIVGGEPVDDGSHAACFPPALAEIGFQEPLAADARKWADGKQVAKLKLVAGLLGLRLDELRQREMQRRRRQQFLTGMGILAATSLAVVAVYSHILQKHEREKAEQLASFVVDLGERLQSDSDLETLALISAEASKNLQGMDQDKLSPETGRKVALAVRQMGRVNQYRDKPEEALEAFTKSRNLFSNLQDKHPDDSQILFELGNAEFFIGNLFYQQGAIEQATLHMQGYFDLTQRLLATDPENPDWIMEFSYAHNNLAALQMDSGKGIDKKTLEHVAEATRLMEKAVNLKPEDDAVIAGYSTVLAWAADAQLQACNITESSALRNEVFALAEKLSNQNPANNELKQTLAFAINGVARMQNMSGEYDEAIQSLRSSISLLQRLADIDPSNVVARQEVVYRRVLLAKLSIDLGDPETAKAQLGFIEQEFEPRNELSQRAAEFQRAFIDFLVISASLEYENGNQVSANQLLQTALRQQQEMIKGGHRDVTDKYRLAHARFLWWNANGSDNTEFRAGLFDDEFADASEFQSCKNADAAMRMAIISRDQETASREAAYLLSKGYAAPDFIKICKQQNLCTPQQLQSLVKQ